MNPTLTPEQQLDRWVEGESLCPNTRGECCPDFSCCMPDLAVPIWLRVKYRDATPEDREAMCVSFLASLEGEKH